MPFVVGYGELFEISDWQWCLIKGLQRLLKDVSIMNFRGNTILGNYWQTKAKPGGIIFKSMKSSLQRERGGTWYSNGRGDQKLCHKVCTYYMPSIFP